MTQARFSLYLWLHLAVSALTLAIGADAAELKVMTFNTMCDVCKDHREYGKFTERLDAIADVIRRHDPDLISIQEIRTKRQVKRLATRLRNRYSFVYARGALLSYPDSALLIRKKRFRLISTAGGWLGPKWPRISLGWETALPRRIQKATLEDRVDGTRFHFVGSHFDNGSRNKENSAAILSRLVDSADHPTVFAGDTNLMPESQGYRKLASVTSDTYHEVPVPEFVSNGEYTENEACHYPDRHRFPECRIDHVLLSRGSPWKVRRWSVDLHRYGPKRTFPSDHRAVIVVLDQ